MRAQNWLKAMALLSAFALAGCSTPTTTTTTVVAAPTGETLLGANEVLTTITGIISDADGNPVPGATVTAGDGWAASMPVDQVINSTDTTTKAPSRTIQSPTTNGQGYFEILVRNPGADSSVGDYSNAYSKVILTVSGGGYYSRQISVAIPTYATIRQTVGSYEEPATKGGTVVIKAAPTGSATQVLTVDTSVTPDVYGGYKLAMNLPRQALYRADAAITGTLLLRNALTSTTDTAATTPLANTQLRVEVKDDNGILMGVVTGNTDATGKFTLTGIPRAKIDNGAMWIDNNNSDYIELLAAVKVNGTATSLGSGDSAYNWVTVQLGSLDLANTAVNASNPYQFGTWEVVTNLPPKITAYAPSTATVKMDPGTNASRTPVSFTFNKTMDTTKSTLVKIYEGSISAANERTAYYTPVLTWDTPANKVLTVTPAIPFKKSTTFVVQLVNFFDSEGVRLFKTGTTDEDKSFTTVDGILFKTASFYDVYGIKQPVATNAAITMTFTATPVAYDTSATKLQKWNGSAWADVAATITIVGASNQLNIVPAVNMAPATPYRVIYGSLTSNLPDDTAISTTNAGGNDPSAALFNTFLTKASVKPVLIGSSLLKYGASGTAATPGSVTVADEAYPVSAVIAPITLTFDVPLVNNTWATPVTLQDTGTTSNGTFVEGTVSIAGAVLTFTPKVRLEYNSTYTLTYNVYGGTDSESATGNKTLTFTTDKPVTPKLVSSNTWTEGNLATTTFAVTGTPITLTFDNAVAALNPDALAPLSPTFIVLKNGATVIPSTVSFDATSKIATLTPSGTLLYNTLYTVQYAVGAGYNSETITTKTVTFTTTKQQLAGTAPGGAPWFIIDPLKETNVALTHDSGTSTYYALVEKVAGATTVEYSWTTALTENTVGYSTPTNVTPGTLTTRTVSSVVYYVVPISVNVVSGDTLKFKVRVSGSASTLPTPYSTALTLTDTVSPVVGSLTFTPAGGTGGSAANAGSTWTDTVTNGTSSPIVHTMTISWASPNESLKIGTVNTAGLTGVLYRGTEDVLSGNQVTGVILYFEVAAGAPTTDPQGSATFDLSDTDGNKIDADPVAAGVNAFTIAFN